MDGLKDRFAKLLEVSSRLLTLCRYPTIFVILHCPFMFHRSQFALR